MLELCRLSESRTIRLILWLDHLGRSVLSRVGGHILGIVVAVLFLDWHLVEYCWILGVPVQRIAALVVVHAGSFYGLGSSVVNDKRRSIYNMIEPHRTADTCRVSAVQREYFLDTSASNGEEVHGQKAQCNRLGCTAKLM